MATNENCDEVIVIDVGPAHKGILSMVSERATSSERGAEIELMQSQMRESRKSNAGVQPQPTASPFYRQFDKRRF